jgi:phosphohistidine phosphatase SixA
MKRFLCVMVVLLVAGCAGTPLRDTGAATGSGSVAARSVPAGEPFVNARAVILVRHADIDVTKKATMGNAAPLVPAGEERRMGLIPMLKDAGVTRLVTSPAVRTQETARPLADAFKLKAEDGGSSAATVLKLLQQTAKAGDVIVVVHHHSAMPGILAGFGFEHESEAVDATEFDRVYVIIPDAATRTYVLLRMRYGGKW